MENILRKNTEILQRMLTFENEGTDLYNSIMSQIKENLDEIHSLVKNKCRITEFKIIPLRYRVKLNLDKFNSLGYIKNIKSAIFRELTTSIEKESMIFEVDEMQQFAEGLLYVAVKKD